MFCPECRSEFRPEIARCPDCGVALVPALARVPHDEPRDKPVTTVVVLRTGDAVFLPVALALLESAEIPFWVEGEESWGMLPLWLVHGPMSERGIEVVVRVPAGRPTRPRPCSNAAAKPPAGAGRARGARGVSAVAGRDRRST